MNVLVVDDEQLVRWFLERALRKWGHEVTTAASGQDALHLLEDGHYDILFTDLRMPEGQGTDLIDKVLEGREGRARIKVVVCSAFVTAELAEDFKKRGIGTIKKPFKLSELEEALREACSSGIF
jgi:DNA-binding NtrC family response regulator